MEILFKNQGFSIIGALIGSIVTLVVLAAVNDVFVKSINTSKTIETTMIEINEKRSIMQFFSRKEICTETLAQTRSIISEEESAEEVKYKIPFTKNGAEYASIQSIDLFNEEDEISLIIKSSNHNIKTYNSIKGIKKIELSKGSDFSNSKYTLKFHPKEKIDSKNPFYQSKPPTSLPIYLQTREIDTRFLKIIECGLQATASGG